MSTFPTSRLVGSPRTKGMTQLHQALPLIERQHALIEALRGGTSRFLTAAALADLTGTSTRTIERDIARLIDAGIPIAVQRGPGGGYRLAAPTLSSTLIFTSGEVAALVASLVAVGPYTSATAQSAMRKLMSTFEPPR